jgi:DNA-binding NtrC family response regulator
VDVRIIATTNRNLADCVKENSFREDLFYRLNVVNLTLPPLRERLGDVRILSSHFMAVYATKNGKDLASFSPEALTRLETHVWPGNVRELENVIERAVITAKTGVIAENEIYVERRELNAQIAHDMAVQAEKSWNPGQTLDDIERNVILEALSYHHGNRTHTARALGISIRTLRNKLADYRRLGINV